MVNRRSFLVTGAVAAVPLAAAPPPPTTGGRARLRTAICAYSFRDALAKKQMTYDDLVRWAVDTRVDGLDLTVYWFPSTEDSFLLPLRALAYRNGVEIYSISIRSNMCHAAPEDRDKELVSVKKWVDVAAKLGAGHIRVFGGTVPKGQSEDAAAGWVVDVLGRAAEYAGSRGVILGLENHGGITSRAERIVEIVKKVNSPWVGVNLDTGNFDRDAYTQIMQIMPYAVNVQFKAEIRAGMDGKEEPADWERLTKMIAGSGYRGYLALEYEAKDDPTKVMPAMLEKLNALARKYSG
jgi:sugar phosphate isomerase/epimerase